MRIKNFILLTSLTMLVGCDLPPQPVKVEMQLASELSSESSRISVIKLSQFEDSLAYREYRGVYLIKDKQTGAEFIGVSGIGISELGSHTKLVGKVLQSTNDER